MNEYRHKVRDIGVRMRRDGKGPPLVYLHGPHGLPSWSPFFAQLAQTHEVVVPEHPGFGTSDNPAWIRNVGDMAMYYLDFLDGLDAQRVHVVGHALGGWIAAELAVRNAARLKSLTLIAPAGVRQKGLPAGDNFIWSPEEVIRNAVYDPSLAEEMLAYVPSDEEADLALTNRFMAAKLGWEPRWFNPALERWLHRIPVPTLVLWGADDKYFPSQYAERWREKVPDITVEILPQCGHLPQLEKPDVTAARIVRFLKGHAS